jgi:ATP-dependent Clp protease protease subunit
MKTIIQNSKLRYGCALTLAAALSVVVYLFCPVPDRDTVVNTYLYGEVNEVSTSPVIAALNAATENDIVVIHIESPGGSVLAGYWVIDAIKETKAKVVEVKVDGFAASMAAVITMYADKITLDDNAVMLFHSYSVNGVKVTPSDDKMLQLMYQQSVAELARCCSKVLSQTDLFKITYEQEDLVFSGEEIMERLKKYNESHK